MIKTSGRLGINLNAFLIDRQDVAHGTVVTITIPSLPTSPHSHIFAGCLIQSSCTIQEQKLPIY